MHYSKAFDNTITSMEHDNICYIDLSKDATVCDIMNSYTRASKNFAL